MTNPRTLQERLRYYDLDQKRLLSEAAAAIDSRDQLIADAIAALEQMLCHFGNPKRDEWLNYTAFELAKGADARASTTLAKLKAATDERGQ